VQTGVYNTSLRFKVAREHFFTFGLEIMHILRLLHGKMRFTEKKLRPIGGGGGPTLP